MPRSANQKKKLSVLRSILLERSDESHPLTMKELISALAAHGIKAERKSVYSDIETLRELGTDIKTVRGKTVGYYVAARVFELPELKLLVDSVRASKFITEKKSSQLISKLSSLASVHDRRALNRASISRRLSVCPRQAFRSPMPSCFLRPHPNRIRRTMRISRRQPR